MSDEEIVDSAMDNEVGEQLVDTNELQNDEESGSGEENNSHLIDTAIDNNVDFQVPADGTINQKQTMHPVIEHQILKQDDSIQGSDDGIQDSMVLDTLLDNVDEVTQPIESNEFETVLSTPIVDIDFQDSTQNHHQNLQYESLDNSSLDSDLIHSQETEQNNQVQNEAHNPIQKVGNHMEQQLLSEIQDKIGYEFDDIKLLQSVFVTPSYAHDHKNNGLESNDRMEYLGDSILNFVVADWAYRFVGSVDKSGFEKMLNVQIMGELHIPISYKLSAEKMTNARKDLVANAHIAGVAFELGLVDKITPITYSSRFLKVSKGQNISVKMVADMFEALVAAIYLDSDMITVTEWLKIQLKLTENQLG